MVKFPENNKNFLFKSGKTIVYLIIYQHNFPSDLSDYYSYLYLDGSLISDDYKERYNINKKLDKISIDELVYEQIENDIYNQNYFPNINNSYFDESDISKYLSFPLISSIQLATKKNIIIDKKTDKNWYCTVDDLDTDGKQLYNLMKKTYHGKTFRILTFKSSIK